MPERRTYLVQWDGKARMVDAVDRHRAERHVLRSELEKLRKARLGEIRPAKAIELSQFVRGGGTIEQEGEAPPADRPSLLDSLEPDQPAEDGKTDGPHVAGDTVD